jgi:hypothetical protein
MTHFQLFLLKLFTFSQKHIELIFKTTLSKQPTHKPTNTNETKTSGDSQSGLGMLGRFSAPSYKSFFEQITVTEPNTVQTV